MDYFPKLVGENIYLSPPNVKDYEIYTKWANDIDCTINITLTDKILSLESEKSFLESIAKDDNSFVIVLKETGEPIGNCGYFDENKTHRYAELGIMIGEKEHWSKGYGTEAMNLLLDFGFYVRNYNRLELTLKDYNKRALKCYEKVGFKLIGTRREALIYGKYKCDTYLMDKLASEHELVYLDLKKYGIGL